MTKALSAFFLLASAVSTPATSSAQDSAANFLGVKACAAICHKTEKAGNQLGIWEKSRHAQAYTSLTTAKANEIATAKGLTKPAAESPECLQCHTLGVDAKVDLKDGVQCEVCHGAGSAYKNMSVMKERAKAVAAGMKEYKDVAAIERQCRTCHNEKSPTMKEFNFSERWAQIRHPVPKNP